MGCACVWQVGCGYTPPSLVAVGLGGNMRKRCFGKVGSMFKLSEVL